MQIHNKLTVGNNKPNASSYNRIRMSLLIKRYIGFKILAPLENKGKSNLHKGGRHPKKDPAVHRYSISLNAEENAQFLSLFEQSGMNVKAHFITACIFEKPIKTVKIDKATMDYYIRLTDLFGQFRAVGVNYNQVVKLLYHNFSEKKAAVSLYKLEKQTIELVVLCQKIIQLGNEFESKYLKKND